MVARRGDGVVSCPDYRGRIEFSVDCTAHFGSFRGQRQHLGPTLTSPVAVDRVE